MSFAGRKYYGPYKVPRNPNLTLSYCNRDYISQHMTTGYKDLRSNLPYFELAITALELATGFKWVTTSCSRRSPSHSRGVAVDVSPDISPSSARYYAVNFRSDPVLYKRERLIRAMQDGLGPRLMGVTTGITFNYFIEPDHIHIHLSARHDGDPLFRIVKFGGPKACYPDSRKRSKLPLIKGRGYF